MLANVVGEKGIPSPCGNPIRVYDLERTLCDILRGSGSDIQIVGSAMKKYAASKEKDIGFFIIKFSLVIFFKCP